MSDVARNPAFAPEEIERQRQQILSGLKVSYEDPDYIAGDGVRPAGLRLPSRTASRTRARRSRSRASRATICVAFHKAWFGANNAILAIVGDVTPEEAFAGAERAFGNWARVGSDRRRSRSSRRRRRGASSSSTGPARCRPRSASATSACRASTRTTWRSTSRSKILGGEGGNRLHRVLRSERGLTYGAVGRRQRAQGRRRHRRRDRHAVRDDRRGAAADRRRVLAAAAPARAASASWPTRRRI